MENEKDKLLSTDKTQEEEQQLSLTTFQDRGRLTRLGQGLVLSQTVSSTPTEHSDAPTTSVKLALEAQLVADGLTQASRAKILEFTSAPLQNTAAFVTTTAAASGLGYAAQRYLPRLVPCLKLGLAVATAAESIPALQITAGAMYDTWQNPAHYKQNQSLVAQYLGKPLLDFGSYAVAGVVGLHKGMQALERANKIASSLELQATHKPVITHFPYLQIRHADSSFEDGTIKQLRFDQRSKLSRMYQQKAPSIVKLDGFTWIANQPSYIRGTGFIVDHDLIATNNHVINKNSLLYARATLASGEHLPLRLVARDKLGDLALLQIVSDAPRPKSLQLGSSTSLLRENSHLYIIGHHGGVSRATASVGTFLMKAPYNFTHNSGIFDQPPTGETFGKLVLKGRRNLLEAADRPEEPTRLVRQELLRSTTPTLPGASGSPVFDEAGAVVGIHSRSTDNLSHHVPVENLKALITVYRDSPTKEGWLNVLTHAPAPLAGAPISAGKTTIEILRMQKFGLERLNN